jgi:hypothetical protein
MRDDYSDLDWTKAKRGQVVEAELAPDDPRRFLVILEPDLREQFPTTQSVNDALRAVLRLRDALPVVNADADADRSPPAQSA